MQTILQQCKQFLKPRMKKNTIIICLICFIVLPTIIKSTEKLQDTLLFPLVQDIPSIFFTNLLTYEQTSFRMYDQFVTQDQPVTPIFILSDYLQTNRLINLLHATLPGFSYYEKEVYQARVAMDNLSSDHHESGPPLEEILKDRKAIDDDEVPKEKVEDTLPKTVLLYNSHNRESFLPHLPTETRPNSAFHEEVNIGKVSERIAATLAKHNIGSIVDDTDIMAQLREKGWDYYRSYDASRAVVETALGKTDSIHYLMDIHRDALPRDKTTVTINNKSYAQILFVVGTAHDKYEQNEALAKKMHALISEKYPNLSKGVLKKDKSQGNGVYNQDLTDQALLLEVGGYENSLKEMYRSADIIAEIFSEIYFENEKVNR